MTFVSNASPSLGLVCLLLIYLIIPLSVASSSNSYIEFPELKDIPIVEVRRVNATSTESVASGLLELVGLTPHHSDEKDGFEKRFTSEKFKRLLQCPTSEPGLNGDSGAISMMKLLPPTRAIIELVCAWDETRCRDWEQCSPLRDKFKAGRFNKEMPRRQFDATTLLRVINGSLYDDWPWGVDRLDPNHHHEKLLLRVLARVSDIKDSVFFKGVEVPVLPFNFPVPYLHVSAKEGTNHIAWPWPNAYKAAKNAYPKTVTPETYWAGRQSKAAFFSTYTNIRRIIYDQAIKRPDLFEIGMVIHPGDELLPWDPSQPKKLVWPNSKDPVLELVPNTKIGSAAAMVGLVNNKAEPKEYNQRSYKYNIVMSGLNGQASADRLASLLSQSGAVVLMQKTSFLYHFSDRLKPWVHYVPLSYSGADAIEKIEWLIKNDEAAQRIANNAQAFAKSYLRLEDYYCYAVTALETVSEVEVGTDATQPFSPRRISVRKGVAG